MATLKHKTLILACFIAFLTFSCASKSGYKEQQWQPHAAKKMQHK